MILVGSAIRVVLAFTTHGNVFDLRSLAIVTDHLVSGDVLHLYSHVNAHEHFIRWPYPPGYFPVLLLTHTGTVLGLPFTSLVRLAPIAADAALAVLVFSALRARGERTALAGAALVALGPSFIANSGHHGQLDSVAVLPAVVALLVWQRGGAHRAVQAGLLLGVAASVKSVPGLFVLALLPTVLNRREALRLVATAVAVPVALLAPFLITDGRAVVDALSYRGLPGVGGLSLLAQPSLANDWLGRHPLVLSPVSENLQSISGVLVAAAVAATAFVLWRRSAPAPVGAAAIALCLWVFGTNYALGYVVWGLPFLLLCGWVKQVAWLQALLLVPTVMIYAIRQVGGFSDRVVYGVYVPFMVAVLLVYLGGYVQVLRRTRSLVPA
jgi:hypothetical protein